MRASSGPDNDLGITLNLYPVRLATGRETDAEAAHLVDGDTNRLFLDPVFRGTYPEDMVEYYRGYSDFSFVHDGDLEKVSTPVDFLGVNYYMRHAVAEGDTEEGGRRFLGLPARPVMPEGVQRTAMGWPIEPDGLTDLLVRLNHEYTNVPIYITGNGAAFYDYADPEGKVKDEERDAFLDAHFRAAREAIELGVDL